MDFLGQLLAKQERPPPASEARKKEIAAAQKAKEVRQKNIAMYEEMCAKGIDDFVRDRKRLKLKFKPTDKVLRSVIHNLASENGLISHSFGEEGRDRYVYVYKKEYPLTEEELRCYREGRPFDPQRTKQTASDPEKPVVSGDPNSEVSTDIDPSLEGSSRANKLVSSANMKRKEREMVRASALEAQVVMVSNESFGDVPAAIKKDKRTMDQVYADMQAKKRLKQTSAAETPPDALL